MENKKIINVKPNIVLYDCVENIDDNNFACISISVLLAMICIIILLYFFRIELIFLYNHLFKTNITNDETQKILEIDNKLSNIFSSKVFCGDDNYLYVDYNNNKLKLKAYNGDYIDRCDKLQFTKFNNNT